MSDIQNKKYIMTVVCLWGALLFPILGWAQDYDGIKPTWATSSYQYPLKNSYLEVVVMSGTNEKRIIADAQEEIERRRRLMVGENDAWIKSGYIASYWENNSNGKTGYFLYQTRRNPSLTPERVIASDKYPFSARVFVPGMAQLYKGQKTKAGVIIGSELVLIGGVITTQYMKANYMALINSTHNNTLKQTYANRANVCNVTSYIALAGAVGVYIWNIIDGSQSRGKPIIINMDDSKILSMVPYLTPEATGLAMSLNF